eukprot:4714504-Alexandrium_andersonii.AAC.1
MPDEPGCSFQHVPYGPALHVFVAGVARSSFVSGMPPKKKVGGGQLGLSAAQPVGGASGDVGINKDYYGVLGEAVNK